MSRDATAVIRSDDATLARDYLAAALAAPQKIAPMPRVCAQLNELSAQDSSDAAQYARLIQADPALAGEVIRVANSPGMRPRSAVISLQQAVSWLGIAEMRNIALAVMLRGEVFKAPGHEIEADELWREGWLAALWAKEIARLRRKHVENSFLAALMYRTGAALTLKALAQFESQHHRVIDRRIFAGLIIEFDAPFSVALMQGWRIASQIIAAVENWRNFERSAQVDLSATVHAAHVLAAHTLHPDAVAENAVLSHVVFESLGIFSEDRKSLLARSELIRAMGAA